MSRFRQLGRLAHFVGKIQRAENPVVIGSPQVFQPLGLLAFHGRGFAASGGETKVPQRSPAADGEKDSLATNLEQATGLEREEAESLAKGVDMFREEWLDAPWGTAEAPVKVPSAFSERVVGVPDPDDDSIIWWGNVKEGEAPKQIVEGGEYFVLEKIAGGGSHH